MIATHHHTSPEEHQVVVIGCGPTGMMLAAELTLAGVDALVVERRATQDLESPRSRGLHARTIEVLDQRGVADRFLAAGTPMQVQAFAGIPLDISDFPSRHHYGLALLQSDFERIMAGWVDELGVRVVRGRSIDRLAPHDGHVDLTCDDGTQLRAEYVVGCDGSRSLARKTTGIEFAGWDPSVCWITSEVEVRTQPVFGLRGGGGIGPAAEGRVGVTLAEADLSGRDAEPTLDDLRAALIRVDGTDYGAHSPRYLSRFTDMTRQAVSYRAGRVLIAGDAAHVHAPLGGQGLNLGVQDAVNLGWKLARVVHGSSPSGLLDTYERERHPVAARVMANTMAQRALAADDARTAALRTIFTEVLGLDDARRHVAAMISGLDIHYGADGGHPMIGRRVPDVDLTTADGPTRLYALLHRAEPLLLRLDAAEPLPDAAHTVGVRRVDATCTGVWELPVIGEVAAPTIVLVRPDGYVAWAGTGDRSGLGETLTTWFGAAPPLGGAA